MEIHFLKEDALAALKANVQGNIKNYSQPTNEWIYDYFGGENPFAPYKTQVNDFQLISQKDDGQDLGAVDTENAIRLYESMKGISDTQATEERLWAGLCHGDFWGYMNKRWENAQANGDIKAVLESRYFFKNGTKRSLFTNTLSRLWWMARLTYDPNRKDPYELTRYMSKDFASKILILFSSNYMGNSSISRGLISALIELENNNYTLPGRKQNVFIQAGRFLNVFGGTHILDYFSEEEIKSKVLTYMWGLAGATSSIEEKKPIN